MTNMEGHTGQDPARSAQLVTTPLRPWDAASSCFPAPPFSFSSPHSQLVMRSQFSTKTTRGKSAPECGAINIHSSMVRAHLTSTVYATKLGLVSFDSTSQGHLAMVIYEWKDYQYLGKVTSETDDYLPVSVHSASTRDTLISLVSRRRMCVPPTLCEVASVMNPVLVALFSICQLGCQLKTQRSGLQESRSLGAKEALTMRRFKRVGPILQEVPHIRKASVLHPSAEIFRRVRLVSTPTLVRPVSSFTKNRYNISSAKLVIIASVCLYTVCERSEG